MVIPERTEQKYEPYPEYKDSGVEWLGKIPVYWEILSLRRKLQDGQKGIKIGPFGSSLKLNRMQDSGWKVYGQENIITGDFSLGDRYVDDDKYKELEACSTGPGDILITMMGTVGCCQVVPSNAETGLMDSHLLRLRVKQAELLAKFLALLIDRAQYIKDQLNKFGRGSIMQGLNSSIIKELLIAVPPILEQEKILDFLGHETARIDELIAKKQRLIALLQEQRTALITRTVTKGLNPDAPMRDSSIKWMGEIPAHWEVRRLKAVTRFAYGDSLPEEQRQGDSVPVFGSNGLVGYHDRANTVAPCIVIGRKGSFGKVVFSEMPCFAIDTTFFIDRSQTKEYLRWLYYCLLCLELDSFSRDSAVPGLSREDAYYRFMPHCTIQEQQAIAEFLDKETFRIDNLVSKINQAVEKLQEYRTALITAAVTGKIDVMAKGVVCD